MKPKRSSLDYALLGLLARKQATGYDLRKIFQETPLGMYSDSPGSIYPALGRLEARGWVVGQGEPHGRRRRMYALTPAGRRTLEAWLREPVSQAQLARGHWELDLKLAFLSDCLPGRDLERFLRGYADAVEAHLDALLTVRRGMAPQLSHSAGLAFDMGIATARARAAFSRLAARRKGRTR